MRLCKRSNASPWKPISVDLQAREVECEATEDDGEQPREVECDAPMEPFLMHDGEHVMRIGRMRTTKPREVLVIVIGIATPGPVGVGEQPREVECDPVEAFFRNIGERIMRIGRMRTADRSGSKDESKMS
jgi:hypothetical protein